MAFASSVISSASSYLGYAPKQLSVDMAIEIFRDLRNYPVSYTDEMISSDMNKNIGKITMAVVEIDAKEGVEGQISHNDNGTNRNYGTSSIPKAYATVVQFAHY